jgi:multidrug efflux pump
LPVGYRVNYAGESRRFVQRARFLLLFGSSLVFIYPYCPRSSTAFAIPLIVLVSVPLSIFGALVPLAGNDDAQHLHAGRLSRSSGSSASTAYSSSRNNGWDGADRRTAVEAAGLRLRRSS